ncbi:unnamed protein product [Wuchereria bancrofti]|nr:unnamed protein product [Wuchereria bancrofti]
MNELQKKEKELRENLNLFAARKKEQQKGAATKEILKNLRKDESPKKKTEVLKQCKKSSVDRKVSKKHKTGSMRRVKSCSVHGNITGNIETSNKKKKTVKNQLAHQEIFENSEVEISNYHSAGISASATHTPSEVSVEKEGGNVNLKLSNDIAEKRSKNKTEKEDEDDTLFNVDPIMPDMDLPSLRLNAKTE